MTHQHEHDFSEKGKRRLWLAVFVNMLLTVAQVVGGIVSGSLSLIADALHNFSDAASLLIALIAIHIGCRPTDEFKTFGYKRAETVAAVINLTTLILIGLYLAFEAVKRFYMPEPILGWVVVIIAGVALIVDVITSLLTYSQSKHSMNIKAAFLHNVADALASLGVIISGAVILLYGWVWADALMTLLISGYVLWQGFTEIPKAIHLLMEGVPEHIIIDKVVEAMKNMKGVTDVHHVHIWQLDENRNALEAHVVVSEPTVSDIESIKKEIKNLLSQGFNVTHSTLEFEPLEKDCGTC